MDKEVAHCSTDVGIPSHLATNDVPCIYNEDEPFIEEQNMHTLQSSEDTASKIKGSLKKYARKCCTKKTLERRLPIVKWLPKYSLNFLVGDFVAGVTVALTVIPQAIAYALIANLPPQYGLYSSFMGCLVYIIFGSIKDLTLGPTAIISLLTAEYAAGNPGYAILLCFLSGCVQIAFGILNLGFLIDFISTPVIGAFTSSAAIIIATSQLKGLFGVKLKSAGFFETIINFFKSIPKTNPWDISMGISVVIVLLLLRALNRSSWPMNSNIIPTKVKKPLKNIIWLTTTARNAIVIVITAGIAYAFLEHDIGNLSLTGKIDIGLPPFGPPEFSFVNKNGSSNVTTTTTFLEAVSFLGSGILTVPLITTLESIAIAKVFSGGTKLDASQEMITLGIVNLLASFASSYPIAGSFSRSAINASSGVKTTFGGFFTAAIVIIALAFLGPSFQYIPKSALSGMIFVAVIFMVHFETLPYLWKINKIDLLLYIITFFACLGLGLEYGILIGSCASILLLLYHHARPTVHAEKITVAGKNCLKVKPDRGIFYPAAEYVRSSINKKTKGFEAVILDAGSIYNSDFTFMKILQLMLEDSKKKDLIFVIVNAKGSLKNDVLKMNLDVRMADDIDVERIIQETIAEKIKEEEQAKNGAVVQNEEV